MKRVRNRAACVLVIVLACCALMGLFLFGYVARGAEWAGSVYNGDAYTGGRLRAGTVTDRHGEVLYSAADGVVTRAADELTRRATLHVVGDGGGNIGSGAILRYASKISGFDLVNGLWTPDGAGGTLRLSVDAGVSRAALEAMDQRRGAVVVINYLTGEIICAVSSPGFDPDAPPQDPDDDSGVYLNRGFNSTYTPGSVFKLVTLAAALERIPDIRERDFRCSGVLQVAGGQVTCQNAHGDMKIEDALASSCNCVFAQLALELGGQVLGEYAQDLGLVGSLQIDGLLTAAGRFEAAPQGSLELAWSGAGQYETLICPVAMARFAAAIAAGGQVPALTELAGSAPAQRQRLMDGDTAREMSLMMDYCTVRTYGDENFPGLDIRAKSGTAEVDGGPPHAWFVGFNADEDAPYAFAVILERSGSGASEAGPVANAALQAAVGK